MSNIDEKDLERIDEFEYLPIIPLRGMTIFPDVVVPLDIGRDISMKAVEVAMATHRRVAFIPQKEVMKEDVEPEGLHKFGCIGEIKQLVKLSSDRVRLVIDGKNVCQLLSVSDTVSEYMLGRILCIPREEIYNDDVERNREIAAISNQIKATFFRYAEIMGNVPDELLLGLKEEENVERLCNVVLTHVDLNVAHCQSILEERDLVDRLKIVREFLNEIEKITMLEKKLNEQMKSSFESHQKEAYLKEKYKVIAEEIFSMGGTLPPLESVNEDIYTLTQKLDSMVVPEYVFERVTKELNRLNKLNPMSPEYGNNVNYIETVLSIPWEKEEPKKLNLDKAKKVLDKNHYGMEEVKERILDFLAVKALTKDLKGPIICLYGPPGVGKTSIAKSIAEALDRPYVRLSLGGTHDQSDIRGHRRTYVSSMPGRIINAMREAKKSNPLMLLDEIDKATGDNRGSLAAALLEVLDSEQNSKFTDHYVDMEYDLSDVFFVATANDLSTIDRPLLDRMEIIDLTSYTELEKFHIAKKHLIKKQLEQNGIEKNQLSFTNAAINEMILCYTKEAGVRELERCIGKVCRKAARLIASNKSEKIKVDVPKIHEYLGVPKYSIDSVDKRPEVGVVNGLAYTTVGGTALKIEVNTFKGTGQLQLTGTLGDVMKESARIALSWIKANASDLKLSEDFAKEIDVHVHVPEGAVPKDGPSAGITLVTAMVSQFTGIPVDNYIAMTGEVTLRGNVLAIGGLKEKLFGAMRLGIKTVLIPKENEKDLEKIPDEVKEKLEIIPVEHVKQVLDRALIRE